MAVDDSPSREGFGPRSLIAAIAVAILIVGFGAYALWPRDDSDSEAIEPSSELGEGPLPTQIVDGIPLGFERSETGAVAAAIAWVPRLIAWPPEERPAVLLDQLTGPASDFWGPDAEDGGSQLVATALAVTAPSISTTDGNPSEVRLDIMTMGTSWHGEPGESIRAYWEDFTVVLVWEDEGWMISSLEEIKGVPGLNEPPGELGDWDGWIAVDSLGGTQGPVIRGGD